MVRLIAVVPVLLGFPLLAQNQVAAANSPATWTDPSTKLTWATNDSPAGMSWDYATNYCKNLSLGGLTDWRLPTTRELLTTVDPSTKKSYRTKDPIEIHRCCIWSSVPGPPPSPGQDRSAEFVRFFRGDRETASTNSGLGALCVRGAQIPSDQSTDTAARFSITPFALPTPAGEPSPYVCSHTTFRAINDLGTAVGDCERDNVGRAFAGLLYADGKFTRLSGPLGDGLNMRLLAINNAGTVLAVQAAAGGDRYFRFNAHEKQFTPMGLGGQLNGQPPATIHLTRVVGLAENGDVFGVYSGGQGECAVRGTSALGRPGSTDPPPDAGSFSLIGCPAPLGASDAKITGVSAAGTVGTSGLNSFLMADGAVKLLRFPASPLTAASAINDAGVVVGQFQVGPMDHRGFIYRNGQFSEIVAPKASLTLPLGISQKGEIVGQVKDLSNRAFIASTVSPGVSAPTHAPPPPPAPIPPAPVATDTLTPASDVQSISVWADSARGLMWTARDNGKPIPWKDAVQYCRNIKLEGDTDWRLASAAELIALHEVASGDDSPFHLSIRFVWSSSVASMPGTTWVVNVADGDKTPMYPSVAMASALCVRRAGSLEVKQLQAKTSVPAPPAPKEKTYQDKGEYDICGYLVRLNDPAELVPQLSSWQDKYPDSPLAADRMYYFALTLSQFPMPAPVSPEKFEALQRIAQPRITIRPGNGPLTRRTPNLDEIAVAAHLVISNIDNAFNHSPKTAGVSDADWAMAKSQELAVAHKALGWVAASRNDHPTAKREYQLSLQADPDQPELASLLGAMP